MSGYRQGDPKAICDQCGREYHLSELRKNYKGLKVCPKDWEPRHPQELRRPVRESIGVKDPRPEKAYTCATTNTSTLLSEDIEAIADCCAFNGAVAGQAVADCAIAGSVLVRETVPNGTFTNTL